MKIIFAGTPDFAVAPLKALAREHQIVAIFTQPDRKAGRGKKLTAPPVKQYALEIGAPIFQPSTLKDQAALIRSFDAEIMVVVAYGMLLPQEILDIPPLGCLNIHASLLPLDTGPVYNMLKLDITCDDTSQTIHDQLGKLGATGICNTIRALENNPELAPQPQDDAFSTYAKKITKSEAELDWNKSASEIHQQLRAFIPWPVSQTHHQGTRLRVCKKPLAQ